MAASAAVIGRQLRQQASSSRISGPVVPPTQYKGSGSSARATAADAAAAALSRARPSSFSSGHHSRQASQQGQGPNQGQSSSSSIARTSSFYGALDQNSSSHHNLLRDSASVHHAFGGSNPSSITHTGADADKNFAKFSQLYSHEFYPHPAHRAEAAAAAAGDGRGDRRGKKRSGDKKSGSSRRVLFSSRCWWVAVKAHCPGVVLVLVGTLMSVVGFYADSLSEIEAVPLKNGTMVEKRTDDNLKAHLHNLTYVGPVIMGLGGMVLVAACVLTFEVRDTLGVQMAAVQPTESSPDKTKAKSKVATTEDGQKKVQRTKRGEMSPRDKETPATKENNINRSSSKEQQYPVRQQPNSAKQQPNGYPPNKNSSSYSTVNLAGAILTTDPQVHQQLSQSEVAVIEISNLQCTTTSETKLPLPTPTSTLSSPPLPLPLPLSLPLSPPPPPLPPPLHHRYQQHQSRLSKSSHHYSHPYTHPYHQSRPHTSAPLNSRSSISTSDLFSIDMSFVRIPSPAETELSDPEGCSLHTLTASGHSIAFPQSSRWRSRCSCSGSPTNSMVLAVQYEGGGNQWLQSYSPSLSGLPNRYSKILASVESDGLSASTASSEWDIRGGGAHHHLLMRRSSAHSESRQQTQQNQQQFYGTSTSTSNAMDQSSYHHHRRKTSRGSLGLPVNSTSLYKGVDTSYPLLELPTPNSPHG